MAGVAVAAMHKAGRLALVLFAAEAYTGSVLRAFSDEMEAVIALAFFIPLLIGTGGNTGTQIATTGPRDGHRSVRSLAMCLRC